jgi:hypothetical protein
MRQGRVGYRKQVSIDEKYQTNIALVLMETTGVDKVRD